ncbi:MAG: phosphoribosylaminoimidazolesuccinocarboxamide synthase, partial [Planctomycetota bacterium]
MPNAPAVMSTDLPLPNKRQGKVRDVYDCTLNDGTEALLLVATDRLSAFDVVMPNGPAGKGTVLTQMSAFWFEQIKDKLGY